MAIEDLLRRYSQHFLIDERVKDKILSHACLSKEDLVLEIGPGKGFLTKALLEKGGKVIAVEKDPSLIPYLRITFPSLELYEEDILDFDFSLLGKVSLIANIPYHITKPILLKVKDHLFHFSKIILMVQKEVGEKLTASCPATYFSALIQSYFTIDLLFLVPNRCFSPPPQVDSCVISLSPKEESPSPSFLLYLEKAFSQKRKQLASLFKEGNMKDILMKLDIKSDARAETLSLLEHKKIFDLLHPGFLDVFLSKKRIDS